MIVNYILGLLAGIVSLISMSMGEEVMSQMNILLVSFLFAGTTVFFSQLVDMLIFKNEESQIMKLGSREIEISRNGFWLVVAVYSSLVLVLQRLDTRLGNVLYTISFLALILGIIFIVYQLIKQTVIYLKNK